jgi:uncharacterized protein
MNTECERRSAQVEIRAKGRRLEGYAALFNHATIIGGKSGFFETIAPGAFQRSLTGDLLKPVDVLALVDHDPSRVLARTKSGTLRLNEDSKGLAFDLDVPDTSHGRDVLALAERNDLGGMSFGFTVPDGGDDWRGKKRELRQVNLHEISIVQSWPAYDGTIVYARSAIGRPPSRVLFARRYLETLGG